MAENEIHQFISPKADGGDATLVRPTNWNATHKNGQKMLNNSGGTRSANDVVQLDPSADDATKGSSVAGAVVPVWVVTDTTILSAAQGQHFSQGDATVKVQGNVTRGNYLRLSATAQALEDTGVASGGVPPVGSVGIAKTAFTGGAGTVLAYLFGMPTLYDGPPGSQGLLGANDAVAPNTKFGMSADLVTFRYPNGGVAVVKNVATVTNDLSLDNTNPNGRDQGAVFSASVWVHLYLVLAYTGAGVPVVRSRSSLTAPPTGPALQTGEVAWAYAGPVRWDSSSHLVLTRIQGAWAHYDVLQNALTNGSATVETSIDLSPVVPPNNRGAQLSWNWVSASQNNPALTIRFVAGVGGLAVTGSTSVAGARTLFNHVAPVVAQLVYYLLGVGGAPALSLDVLSYKIPNGGE